MKNRQKTWAWLIVTASGLLFWITIIILLLMVGIGGLLPESDQVAFMYNPEGGFGSNNPGDWNIYLLDVRSRLTMPITDYPGWDRYPEWSADGELIGYHSDQAGTHDIYIMDAKGTFIQTLNIAPHAPIYNEAMVAWSDDGRYIAFHSGTENTSPAAYDLYISGMDVGTTRQVTFAPGVSAHAAWSPDSRHLVFASDQHSSLSSSTLAMSLYILDLESDPNIRLVQDEEKEPPVRQITFDSVDEESLFPAWSPDGEWIAYVYHYYPSQLSQQPGFTNVPPSPGLPATPSLEGQREFERRRALRPLPSYAGNTNAPPGVSGYFQVTDIYLVSPDGEQHINLTNTPFVDTTPDWLPGGDQIIFSSNRDDGDYDLYIMDADGSNVRQLTDLPGDEMAPDWRPR